MQHISLTSNYMEQRDDNVHKLREDSNIVRLGLFKETI